MSGITLHLIPWGQGSSLNLNYHAGQKVTVILCLSLTALRLKRAHLAITSTDVGKILMLLLKVETSLQSQSKFKWWTVIKYWS